MREDFAGRGHRCRLRGCRQGGDRSDEDTRLPTDRAGLPTRAGPGADPPGFRSRTPRIAGTTWVSGNRTREASSSSRTLRGHPLSRTRFRARKWVPAVERAEITPPPNFHDLRHSYAAWLIPGRRPRKDGLQEQARTNASSRTRPRPLWPPDAQGSTDDAQDRQYERGARSRDSRGTLVARPHRPDRTASGTEMGCDLRVHGGRWRI